MNHRTTGRIIKNIKPPRLLTRRRHRRLPLPTRRPSIPALIKKLKPRGALGASHPRLALILRPALPLAGRHRNTAIVGSFMPESMRRDAGYGARAGYTLDQRPVRRQACGYQVEEWLDFRPGL